MDNTKIVVIGGSSGIGLAVAEVLLTGGAQVTIAARNPRAERSVVPVDITIEADVARLFQETGPVDHVIVTAADATGAYQRIKDTDLAVARALIDIKLVGAMLVAKHADVSGSITFTSGIAAYRPAPGGSAVAAVNGALESL